MTTTDCKHNKLIRQAKAAPMIGGKYRCEECNEFFTVKLKLYQMQAVMPERKD